MLPATQKFATCQCQLISSHLGFRALVRCAMRERRYQYGLYCCLIDACVLYQGEIKTKRSIIDLANTLIGAPLNIRKKTIVKSVARNFLFVVRSGKHQCLSGTFTQTSPVKTALSIKQEISNCAKTSHCSRCQL